MPAMKTAFACWDNRIAPVFDTAREIHLLEAEAGRIVRQTRETLPEDLPVQKALRLVGLGVGTLVCGAISRPLQGLVSAYGVHVIPFVAGELPPIIQAWLNGQLHRPTYAMPGCHGRGGRRFRGAHTISQEVSSMQGQGRGRGAGGGKGPGQQGDPRPGRRGGYPAAGPDGECVCPQCRQRELHQRGVPCVERQCPRCGTFMIRQ
jgi:hypothetical protein